MVGVFLCSAAEFLHLTSVFGRADVRKMGGSKRWERAERSDPVPFAEGKPNGGAALESASVQSEAGVYAQTQQLHPYGFSQEK